MTIDEIAQARLNNLLISNQPFTTPEEVVSWLGAMQAQDYTGAKWSIGLRLPDASDDNIEEAIRERRIVRTWPMRGTLHFVASSDIRWMLALLAPRVIASSGRRHSQLDLDEHVFSQTRDLLIKTLEGKKQLTRKALFQVFEASKIASNSQRGIHILQQHALEGLICFGSHEGKQPTFVLMDEWLPKTRTMERDEALAALALRYFTSHGPATLKDFVWWTGLNVPVAREAIELSKKRLVREIISDTEYWYSPGIQIPPDKPASTFLLPGFDEFILGYTNRSAVLEARHIKQITPGGGLFYSSLVINGKVAGTWKRISKSNKISIEIKPFLRLTADQRNAVKQAEERYRCFLRSEIKP